MDYKKLKIDFYESGVGETIIITFPSGGCGVVDAHPSQHTLRPKILELIGDSKLHFVCLTHPHADHGLDLVHVLKEHGQIEAFWHTIFEERAMIFGIEQIPNFPSVVQEYAARINEDWGRFMIDIYDAIIKRGIPRHKLRSDLEHKTIDGVEIHCISPNEAIQNRFFDAYHRRLSDPKVKNPDANLLSAVLVLKYGKGVAILGGDALGENWDDAVREYRRKVLPKAQILKVPHHGAKNSLRLNSRATTYLDICTFSPRANAVLFGGDSRHPNSEVYAAIQKRTNVYCLSNGLKRKDYDDNPLRLTLPGARAVGNPNVCNHTISFEIDSEGNVTVLRGNSCANCIIHK